MFAQHRDLERLAMSPRTESGTFHVRPTGRDLYYIGDVTYLTNSTLMRIPRIPSLHTNVHVSERLRG
jgi:hypothetical protein